MDHPLPLPVAMAQLSQAMSDFTASHDAALTSDPVADRLNAGICLQSLRYIEKHGLTDEGRRKLTIAIDASKAVLGVA